MSRGDLYQMVMIPQSSASGKVSLEDLSGDIVFAPVPVVTILERAIL
jgi:hypothetical protein